jgi:hypothetical protein
MQQALRIAAGDSFEPAKASAGLKGWLASHLGFKDFSGLERHLFQLQDKVAAVRTRKLGPLTTEGGSTSV